MIIRDTELVQVDGSYKSYITDYASDIPTSREFLTFRDIVVFTNASSTTLSITYDGGSVSLENGESIQIEQPILQYTVSGVSYKMETYRFPIFNRGVEIDLSGGNHILTYTEAHSDALVVTVGHATNDIIVPDALLPILINKVYTVANRDALLDASIKTESGINTVVVGPNSTALVRVNRTGTEIERETVDAPIT